MGTLLKQEFDLDYRALYPESTVGKLTRFVGEYLADVLRETGRSGLDRVFAITTGGTASVSQPTLESSAQQSSAAVLWREFVSPNGKRRIFVSRTRPEARIANEGNEAKDHEVEINRITVAELNQVADDFLRAQAVREDERTLINTAAKSGGYGAWLSKLSEIKPNLRKKWSTFRMHAVVNVFRDRLNALSIPTEHITVLVEKLRSTQWTVTPVSERPDQGKQEASNDLDVRHMTVDVSTIRTLALAAVGHMDEVRLRQIEVPLGIVETLVREMLKRGGH